MQSIEIASGVDVFLDSIDYNQGRDRDIKSAPQVDSEQPSEYVTLTGLS